LLAEVAEDFGFSAFSFAFDDAVAEAAVLELAGVG
jgi:hypothetical protein